MFCPFISLGSLNRGSIKFPFKGGVLGNEFEQAPGVGDGQGSLACCSSWGHKESDTTEQLT